jgi:hypothetical protein
MPRCIRLERIFGTSDTEFRRYGAVAHGGPTLPGVEGAPGNTSDTEVRALHKPAGGRPGYTRFQTPGYTMVL